MGVRNGDPRRDVSHRTLDLRCRFRGRGPESSPETVSREDSHTEHGDHDGETALPLAGFIIGNFRFRRLSDAS